MKQTLRFFIALAVTVGALYLAFRGQDFGKMMDEFSHANIVSLTLLVLFQLLAHLVRAWRWRYLLRPMKSNVSLWTSFKAVVVGYAFNNVIPRSGEFARPALIAKAETIPFAGALATIIVERIFDVIALGSLLVFSLSFYKEPITKAFPDFTGAAIPILVAVALGLTVFVIVLLSKRVEERLILSFRKIFPAKIAEMLVKILGAFTNGLKGVQRSSIIPLVLGTVVIWLLYGLSMYFSLGALPGSGIESISYPASFLLLMLSAIAVTIPTPGGTGTYHYFISQALILIFGIASSSAVAFATITHGVQFLAITIIGLIFAFTEGVSFKKDVNNLKK